MRDIRLYLEEILAAIESIESFVSGIDLAAFQADDKTLSATIMKLDVIGEAARQVPEAFRQLHPEVPWKDMVDMRNVLIHVYFGVKVPLVWDTVTKDLPKLKPQIRSILDEWRG